MIKFFRHIRKSLIQKNQMGKYLKYAIGEILLVVLGILIALQINNWNENRKNKITEKQLVERFKLDIEANITELHRIINKTENTHLYIDSILNEYEHQAHNFSLKELGILLIKGRSFTVYGTSEGSINDIIGSGQLDLISNDSIRYAIGSWQSNLKPIREWEKIDRETTDTYRARLDTYLDLLNRSKGTMLNQKSKEAIFKDRVFINYLVDRKVYPKLLNGLYQEELIKMERLLKHIEEAL